MIEQFALNFLAADAGGRANEIRLEPKVKPHFPRCPEKWGQVFFA
jgi:hypothetical protein